MQYVCTYVLSYIALSFLYAPLTEFLIYTRLLGTQAKILQVMNQMLLYSYILELHFTKVDMMYYNSKICYDYIISTVMAVYKNQYTH